MRIYIAGRMRGIAEFNFPAFDHAADVLRALGHECFNPADNDRALGFDGAGWSGNETLAERDFDLREAFGDDLDFIARKADALCVLPGWEQSRGASAEVAVARALGLPIAPLDAFDAQGPIPGHSSIHLDEWAAPGGEERQVPVSRR